MQTYFDKELNDYVCSVGDGKINYLVKAVQPQSDETLLISFADGSRKVFDMKPIKKSAQLIHADFLINTLPRPPIEAPSSTGYIFR
ncbi:hypothetical protein IJ135_00975 [Candidatus Saccharibacteria bacterium]|nr:hypothetical protein [Candidatus Saccharibacteria bacterium]